MARTKVELDRNEKRQEILDVARRLFLETGYELSSMSRIAEEAGVAPNTIYWYFADKDALLIAVLDALVADATREFWTRKKGSLESQVMWLLSKLERLQPIIATVHARAAVSPALGTWHENFHRAIEALLIAELRGQGVPPEDLVPASLVATFVIEGLLAHQSSAKERRALVRWLVSDLQRRQGA